MIGCLVNEETTQCNACRGAGSYEAQDGSLQVCMHCDGTGWIAVELSSQRRIDGVVRGDGRAVGHVGGA
jgi:hypothetical protein